MAKLSDVQVTSESRWFTYYDPAEHGRTGTKMRFKILSINNPAYRKRARKYRGPDKVATGFVGARTQEETVGDHLPEHSAPCVEAWEGVDDDDGKPIPYSPEKCLELFLQKENAGLVTWVFQTASDAASFLLEMDKATVGKSTSTSPG